MYSLIVLVVVVVLLAGFMLAGFVGAPWVPARQVDVEAMLDAAKLTSGHVFIELGCGDGRLLMAAARRGAQATGYEINPLLCLIAKVRTLRYGRRVNVRWRSFWSIDLTPADVVMAFLMPKFMDRLDRKATAELKPGARLISYVFKLPARHPSRHSDHWFVYTF